MSKKKFVAGFKLLKGNRYVNTSVGHTLKLLFGNRFFAVMVVIPTIVYFLYNAVIFTPRYESISFIAIKDNSGKTNSGALGALLGSSSDSTTNPYMLKNYIQSMSMLLNLNSEIGLISLYQNKNIDFFSRLASDSDQKQQFKYYLSHINVSYDQDSNSIQLAAQGITAVEAQKIMQTIIKEAQEYVNSVDYQLAEQRLQFAQKQVQISQRKLTEANQKIIDFQNNNGILDPKSEISTLTSILAGLQSQLVSAQATLISMNEFMRNNSFQLQQQQQKIASLQKEIEIQKEKILGLDGGQDKKLNDIMNKFELLRMDGQVAISEYTASITSLEIARADAISQKQQVVVLEKPTLPNFHEYPRLWYDTFTLLIVLLILYGIIRMIKTIIDEHRY